MLHNKCRRNRWRVSVMAGMVLLFGCSESSEQIHSEITAANELPISLFSFEQAKLPDSIIMVDTETVIITDKSLVTEGNKALKITLNAKQNYQPSFTLKPDSAWNWANKGPVKVVIDIANPEDRSSHLFVAVKDGTGITHNRSVSIPSNSSDTYYIELSGGDLAMETGIRSNPADNNIAGTPFIWRWGQKNLDLSEVVSIKFGVYSLLKDRTIIIDNIRLEQGQDYDLSNLHNVIDEFGQNTNMEYADKVHSKEQLVALKDKEESSLRGGLMADRSKFGGWKNGPKLTATGNFRTEKIDGKWSLVDPEGYLFFSNGIANVRMANTSTFTGVDFDQSLIKQREKGDLTPEDSIGLNRANPEAEKTASVTSELRNKLFTWLPEYNDELANHFGYRRMAHSGAMEHGETFSFYRANLERKYGESSPDSFFQNWQESTLQRMMDWGFTSFGNWIDPVFYGQERVPYFANGWIIGKFKTITSGNDYWSPLPDPFDPVFRDRARTTVKAVAEEVKNSPWCVGVFIDNEKSWGRKGSLQSQHGIALNGLAMDGNTSPTKAKFTALLKEKYGDVAKLNGIWGVQLTSWEELNSGIKIEQPQQAIEADLSMLSLAYADQYFDVVNTELKKVMPNHLYMGARFADWGMTPESVRAAANHADVVSYNYYKEGLQEEHWAFLADIDMPSIIGEFHIGATDTGLFNPGLVHAENQTDRAQLYKGYMKTVIDNPYFVGAHWFQYTDSPITGRAYDGENYNVGFVSVTDTPYKELVEAAKQVNSSLYPTRFGDIK